jgi:hypothetical protein
MSHNTDNDDVNNNNNNNNNNGNILSDSQRLELSKMMKEYNAEDNTSKIRELKHSGAIRENVIIMENLKKQYQRLRKTNKSQFRQMCEKRCSFLYNNYTNIFNKLFNDELDLGILLQFIEVLRQVEESKIDQNEGSYMIGMLLKKLYIDSALKKEKNIEHREKLRNKHGSSSSATSSTSSATSGNKDNTPRIVKNISWEKYKSLNLMETEE